MAEVIHERKALRNALALGLFTSLPPEGAIPCRRKPEHQKKKKKNTGQSQSLRCALQYFQQELWILAAGDS